MSTFQWFFHDRWCFFLFYAWCRSSSGKISRDSLIPYHNIVMEASIIIISSLVFLSDRCNKSSRKTVSRVHGRIFEDLNIYNTFIFSINITLNYTRAEEHYWLFTLCLYLIKSWESALARSFENDPSLIIHVLYLKEVLVMLFRWLWTWYILLPIRIVQVHWVKTLWKYFLLSLFQEFVDM